MFELQLFIHGIRGKWTKFFQLDFLLLPFNSIKMKPKFEQKINICFSFSNELIIYTFKKCSVQIIKIYAQNTLNIIS